MINCYSMLSIVVLASLFGCSTADLVRLRSDLTPKPQNCPLEIFAESSKVDRPSEDLCIIDARPGATRFSDQSMNGAIENAKQAACTCGADAIIISGYDAGKSSFFEETQARVKVKAIRFTGPKTK